MTEQLSLDAIPDEPEEWAEWFMWTLNPANNPQLRRSDDDTPETRPVAHAKNPGSFPEGRT